MSSTPSSSSSPSTAASCIASSNRSPQGDPAALTSGVCFFLLALGELSVINCNRFGLILEPPRATGLGESLSATAAAAGLEIKGLVGLIPVVGSDFSWGFKGLMSAFSPVDWHSAFSAGRCFGLGEVEADVSPLKPQLKSD